MENVLSKIVLGAVVIILLGSFLMPIIEDSLDYPVDYDNEDGQKEFVLTDTFSLSTGTVNDADLSTLTPDFGLVVTDKFIAIAYSGGSSWGAWSYLTADGQNLQGSLTVVDGAYTINSTNPVSGTIEWALIPAINGTYSFYGSGASFVATMSDTVYSVATSSANYGVTSGSISDQTTAFKRVSGESVPTYVAELTYSAIEDTNAFRVEGKTSDNVAYVIAPVDVVVMEEFNGSALLFAIPVILILAVLMAFVTRIKW